MNNVFSIINTCEHSFSTLRRLRNWMQSSTSCSRMSSLAIITLMKLIGLSSGNFYHFTTENWPPVQSDVHITSTCSNCYHAWCFFLNIEYGVLQKKCGGSYPSLLARKGRARTVNFAGEFTKEKGLYQRGAFPSRQRIWGQRGEPGHLPCVIYTKEITGCVRIQHNVVLCSIQQRAPQY